MISFRQLAFELSWHPKPLASKCPVLETFNRDFRVSWDRVRETL